MLINLLVFALGLFIGWFFLPAPQFAKNLRDKLLAKFPSLAKYAKGE